MAGAGATYGYGTPLSITNDKVWKGTDKTNGFVMRNSDGRIPALRNSFTDVRIGAANVLSTFGAIPFGNALWIDMANIDTEPAVMHAEKPTNGAFGGILELNMAIQRGHPPLNWGLQEFMRGERILKGYIGYKVASATVAGDADYLAYLQGDKTKDVVGVRTTYADWVTALKAADAGSKLGLFFVNTSGFPIVRVVGPSDLTQTLVTGATFAGYLDVNTFEPENEAAYLWLDV